MLVTEAVTNHKENALVSHDSSLELPEKVRVRRPEASVLLHGCRVNHDPAAFAGRNRWNLPDWKQAPPLFYPVDRTVQFAKVDEAAFNLIVEPTSAALIPQPLANGSMSNAMMVAIRRGAQVVIQGSGADGSPVGVAFSAKGFSAAFAAMAKDCNRPGVMGWIE